MIKRGKNNKMLVNEWESDGFGKKRNGRRKNGDI